MSSVDTDMSNKRKVDQSLYDDEDGPAHVLQTNDEDGLNKYKWEKKFERSWDMIEEDELGLRPSVQEERNLRNRRLRYDSSRVRRGMQRHVCLVLDYSKTLALQDLKPSRYNVLLQSVEQFIKEFFDQNPISQLSLIVTKNSKSEKISELSGNPSRHIQAMKSTTAMEGDPSIQNALEVAYSSLCHVPRYGSREIIFLFSSLTTCDPTDIKKTITKLKAENMRVSFIHLAADLFVCKHIAEQTNGVMTVALNEEHFQESLMLNCHPPPTIGKMEAALVEMGFPQQHTSPIPSLCTCHEKMKFSGYICPRCSSKSCELPTSCQICNLTLVSSPHLARSYHHLFPIPLFEEVNWRDYERAIICYGCLGTSLSSSSLYFKCPRCRQIFCLDCDLFIHESLHNCPGCENNKSIEDDINILANNNNHQNGIKS
eukprot:gene961-1224_t